MSWQGDMLGIDAEKLERERFTTYVMPKPPKKKPAEAPAENKWITIKEAAELFHYHRSTIHRLASTGKLQCDSDGYRTWVSRIDLERHAEGNNKGSKTTKV